MIMPLFANFDLKKFLKVVKRLTIPYQKSLFFFRHKNLPNREMHSLFWLFLSKFIGNKQKSDPFDGSF